VDNSIHLLNEILLMLKKALFAELAQIGQVLSSPMRIEILDYLAQAPRSVESLSQLTGLSVANTSRHLQVLKSASLVEVEQRGKQRIYHLADDDVVALLQALRRTAENHLDKVKQLLSQYPDAGEVAPMDLASLKQALEKEEVILMDVRPEEEYQAGHIPNAIHLPPEAVEQAVEKLQAEQGEALKEKTVVAYCRGPYCIYSHQAAQLLKAQNIPVRRLEEGLPEWRAAGHPIEHNLSQQ